MNIFEDIDMKKSNTCLDWNGSCKGKVSIAIKINKSL